MFWLGVDGGGTKTACTLYDDATTPLDRIVLPTCHYAQAGFDGMRDVLERGVRWAEDRAVALAAHAGSAPRGRDDGGAQLPPELGIGFAICGYGEAAGATAHIERIVAEVAGTHPHVLVNDVEAAWAAGLDLADGIVIIAGTGSIALGVCNGRKLRCGGWDYELGDEGSGGWLGKELLRAFTRQADGRDPRGPLHELVRDRLKLTDDFDVIPFAQAHYGERGSIAELAPLVTQAAKAGDASACDILRRAAREEADLVRAITRNLFEPARAAGEPVPHPIPVTYVGGTFKAGPLVLEPLARALPGGCELIAPVHEPDLGAVLLLRRELEAGNTLGRG